MLTAAVIFIAMMVMWTQYLAVMHLKENRSKLTTIAKIWGYPILAIGLFSDFLFNQILGTLFFLELPRELLFTERCSRHLDEKNWRGATARWFCRNFLDPYDIGGKHC